MKIVTNDLFNISERIKKIDKNYFLIFNAAKKTFEVHNAKCSGNSYCLSVPHSCLDCRTLELTVRSQVRFLGQILQQMDLNNLKIEKQQNEIAKLQMLQNAEHILKNVTKF